MKELNCKCGNPATKNLHIEPELGAISCCDNPKCREEIERFIYDTHYRNQYFQGRSKESYETSVRIASVTAIISISILVGYLVWKLVNNFLE
jgi:hypothetical protein